MMILLIAIGIFATASAQRNLRPAYQDVDYPPIPYSFNYVAEAEEGGSSGHQEEGDGSGTVRGSYTVTNLEGHTRVVEYVADENGFRATVRTNEPGTASHKPADVDFVSTAEAYEGPVRNAYADAPVRRVVRPAAQGQGPRYVLVPSTDPRARGQY